MNLIALLLCAVMARAQVVRAPGAPASAPLAITPAIEAEALRLVGPRFETPAMEHFDLATLDQISRTSSNPEESKAACRVILQAVTLKPGAWNERFKAALPRELGLRLARASLRVQAAARRDPELAQKLYSLSEGYWGPRPEADPAEPPPTLRSMPAHPDMLRAAAAADAAVQAAVTEAEIPSSAWETQSTPQPAFLGEPVVLEWDAPDEETRSREAMAAMELIYDLEGVQSQVEAQPYLFARFERQVHFQIDMLEQSVKRELASGSPAPWLRQLPLVLGGLSRQTWGETTSLRIHSLLHLVSPPASAAPSPGPLALRAGRAVGALKVSLARPARLLRPVQDRFLAVLAVLSAFVTAFCLGAPLFRRKLPAAPVVDPEVEDALRELESELDTEGRFRVMEERQDEIAEESGEPEEEPEKKRRRL